MVFMGYIRTFLFIVGIAVGFYAIVSAALFIRRRRISRQLVQVAEPFSYRPEHPRYRILVLGDSTAVGVGVSDPKNSIAGRLAEVMPWAEIRNDAVAGLTTHELLNSLSMSVPEKFYDLILIQIGANDIVRFTHIETAGAYVREVFAWAGRKGKTTALMTSGNIGASRMFPLPIRAIYARRTLRFREKFRALAEERYVIYVDLFEPKESDPFVLEPDRYYAADFFHPSDDGYGVWFARIKKTFIHHGIQIKQ